MKKILGLTVAALLVMALVGGGTWAYFSDPETSTGNILTAGTLDLDIGGGDIDVTILTLSNAAPGDSGSGNTMLANTGTIAGELDIAFSTVVSDDNGLIVDAESDVDSTDGAGNGELDVNIWMAFWLDYEDDNSWNANDVFLKSDATAVTYSADQDSGTSTSGTTLTVTDTSKGWTPDAYIGYPVTVTGKGTSVIITNTATTLTVASAFTAAVGTDAYAIHDGPHYDIASNYASDSIDAVIATMQESGTAGDNYDFNMEWVIPYTVGNIIMSDNITVNLTFTLEQIAVD